MQNSYKEIAYFLQTKRYQVNKKVENDEITLLMVPCNPALSFTTCKRITAELADFPVQTSVSKNENEILIKLIEDAK